MRDGVVRLSEEKTDTSAGNVTAFSNVGDMAVTSGVSGLGTGDKRW